MSKNVLSRRKDPYDYLSRMVEKTTLTTQNVRHVDIIRLGDELLNQAFVEKKEEQITKKGDAVEQAEIRAAREMRAAMKRLKAELDLDKARALEAQKQYYHKLSEKVNIQRDKAETERRRELRRGFEKEKEQALTQQWNEAERLKDEAVQEARNNAVADLRETFEREKREAVEAALEEHEAAHRLELEEAVRSAREDCRQEANRAARIVADKHLRDLAEADRRLNDFRFEFDKEVNHKKMVERDFKSLQNDYKHFMDYTDGRYHSDYMMVLRTHGMQLATKPIEDVRHDPRKLGLADI